MAGRAAAGEAAPEEPPPPPPPPPPTPSEFMQGLAGISAPLGFFDPLGLSKNCKTISSVKLLREAELMHGRVSMMAVLGFFFGEKVRLARARERESQRAGGRGAAPARTRAAGPPRLTNASASTQAAPAEQLLRGGRRRPRGEPLAAGARGAADCALAHHRHHRVHPRRQGVGGAHEGALDNQGRGAHPSESAGDAAAGRAQIGRRRPHSHLAHSLTHSLTRSLARSFTH